MRLLLFFFLLISLLSDAILVFVIVCLLMFCVHRPLVFVGVVRTVCLPCYSCLSVLSECVFWLSLACLSVALLLFLTIPVCWIGRWICDITLLFPSDVPVFSCFLSSLLFALDLALELRYLFPFSSRVTNFPGFRFSSYVTMVGFHTRVPLIFY